MEFFIKKLFEGKKDNLTHLQFEKFSRGDFKERAVVVARKTASSFSIGTSPEYANEFVRYLAEKLGNKKVEVTGIIVSTRKLDIEPQGISQIQGIKKYKIRKEMSGTEILGICEEIPKSFIGLSFKVGDTELKIKEKLPKSGKPGKENEEVKADFCRVKTTDENLVKGLIFDKEGENFKKITITHNFLIKDIVIPDEAKKEKDFAKVREMALKKGKLVRNIEVDGKKIVKETNFEA